MTWPFLVGWISFLGPMVTCHVMKQVFVTGSDFDFDFIDIVWTNCYIQ